MRILGLDLSKVSTGWALWGPGDATAASGTWQLGSEFTSRGRVYANLHARISELNSLGTIEAIYFEEAINPAKVQGGTNIESLKLAAGLAAHVESWGEAMDVRILREVNMATWRRHFLGKFPRPTKTAELKDMAMTRARELGFKPQRHDQAEAIGILSYACHVQGLTPPWELGRSFHLQLETAGAR